MPALWEGTDGGMNPVEARILGLQYTDLVEKVVAKKGLFGWRVLRTDDTERSAD